MAEVKVDIKRVHDRLLEMAKTTAKILEEHNIPYIIFGGTLLGAVRHKGFIPWDDDFDFCLFDDTYDIAVEYLRKELPADLFVEDELTEPNYFHAWVHVKDKRSSAYCKEYPQDNYYSHKGLYLDLYRLKRIKLNELSDYLNLENRKYIMRRKEKGLMDEEDYQRRMKQLIESEERAKEFPESSTRDVFTKPARSKYRKLEINDILPLKRYRFEDCEFFGPQNAGRVLTDIYGDYMKLPPLEKRVCHYSSVSFLEE